MYLDGCVASVTSSRRFLQRTNGKIIIIGSVYINIRVDKLEIDKRNQRYASRQGRWKRQCKEE